MAKTVCKEFSKIKIHENSQKLEKSRNYESLKKVLVLEYAKKIKKV